MKVLIIEDDPEIVDAISFSFKVGWPGIEIVSTAEGCKGIELVEIESPDVIIVDLSLPDIDGFEVIKGVRLFSSIPILVLTVRAEERAVVKALELGANEYVTKPFRQLELLARIKCLVRGRRLLKEERTLFFQAIRLDPIKRKLSFHAREIDLTGTECSLMSKLIEEAPSVATYSSLIQETWGDDYPEASDRLKVHVRHLREKIEKNPSKPEIIQTRPSIGYVLVDTTK